MKDVYYFPHDANARNDPKMLVLKSKYGISGLGMYWAFVEILREQEEFKYQIDKEIIWDSLAVEFLSTPDVAERFISDCINKFKLLKSDGNYIWSESLMRRMKPMLDERERKSAGGKKGMASRWGNKSSGYNSVITELYDTVKNDITSDNKVEDSIVEDSTVEKKRKRKSKDVYISAQHLSMSEEEYKKLVELYGQTIVDDKIEYAKNYAKLKNYKSLYLTINNWLKADKEKKAPPSKYRDLSNYKPGD